MSGYVETYYEPTEDDYRDLYELRLEQERERAEEYENGFEDGLMFNRSRGHWDTANAAAFPAATVQSAIPNESYWLHGQSDDYARGFRAAIGGAL